MSSQKAAQEKYGISKVSFDQIFTGTPPVFPSSKKLLKSPPATKSQTKPGSASKLNKSAKKSTPDKKGRQESMDKFVKKTDKAEGLCDHIFCLLKTYSAYNHFIKIVTSSTPSFVVNCRIHTHIVYK